MFSTNYSLNGRKIVGRICTEQLSRSSVVVAEPTLSPHSEHYLRHIGQIVFARRVVGIYLSESVYQSVAAEYIQTDVQLLYCPLLGCTILVLAYTCDVAVRIADDPAERQRSR